jgi:hypothetical protein
VFGPGRRGRRRGRCDVRPRGRGRRQIDVAPRVRAGPARAAPRSL